MAERFSLPGHFIADLRVNVLRQQTFKNQFEWETVKQEISADWIMLSIVEKGAVDSHSIT